MAAARERRRGMGLIQVLISVSLVGLVLEGLVRSLSSSQDSVQGISSDLELEGSARRTLDRIVSELRDAERATLAPATIAPASSPEINFRVCTGQLNGALIWSGPRRIRFTAGTGQVVFTEDVGLASERSTVIGTRTTDLLEGEIAGGGDENGNGLVDEPGLCFTNEGELLRIRLTMQTTGRENTIVECTVEARIRPRN